MILAALIAILASTAFAQGARKFASQWEPLIQAGNVDQADSLCRSWLKTGEEKAALAEAHKCLANVELSKAQSLQLGSGAISAGYAGPAVDRALEHLNEALRLAPMDLSIHQGRLHVLLNSGRFQELDQALEESLRLHPTGSSLDTWLAYSDELREKGELEAGLSYSRILEKHYPNDHQAVGNIAAFLASLHRDGEALVYAKKAVQMKPDDPIDLWNLAILYESSDKLELADRAFQDSLKYETDEDARGPHSCRFAEFLSVKRGQRAKACELERRYCPDEARACGAP